MTQVRRFEAKPLFADAAKDEHWRLNVAPDGLGEAPTWDHRIYTFYWIDIIKRTLSIARFGDAAGAAARITDTKEGGYLKSFLDSATPSVTRFVLSNDAVGFLALTTRPGVLLMGSSNGLFLFDTRRGAVVQRGIHPERRLPCNRYNDGKVAPNGELWAGTMQYKASSPGGEDHPPGTGRFYRHTRGFFGLPQVAEAIGPTTVSNGLGWNPSGTLFFHADTPTFTVSKYDLNAQSEPVNKRTLRNFGERIDGLCVDRRGNPWVALLDSAKVVNIDKHTGNTLAEVIVPGANLVTSASFGGPGFNLLFITTAAATSPEGVKDVRRKDPFNLSGHIFVAEPHVGGWPSNYFPLRSSSHL